MMDIDLTIKKISPKDGDLVLVAVPAELTQEEVGYLYEFLTSAVDQLGIECRFVIATFPMGMMVLTQEQADAITRGGAEGLSVSVRLPEET